jgi:xanthine dehydrogenase YagT iron-sulfur-binding subunit
VAPENQTPNFTEPNFAEKGRWRPGVNRREFVTGMGIITGGMILGVPMTFSHTAVAEPQEKAAGTVPVQLTINGQQQSLSLDPRVTLLDLLREQLHLTGTKKGCDHGQCGACTVLANGRRINSCLSLAVSHQGEEITTIEGLAKGGELHPLQAAFLEHDGFQCGYCTPGQICSAVAMLNEASKGDASIVTADLNKSGPAELTPAEIRERMSGNICRCGAYPGIVQAIESVHRT